MHTKTSFTLLAALAMVAESVALSHHRHAHVHAHHRVRDLDARRLHTHVEWVTVWETVTVYKDGNGEIKTAGPNSYFANEKPGNVESAPAEKSAEAPKQDVAAPPASPPGAAPAETNKPTSDDRAGGEAPAPANQQSAPQVPTGGKRGFAYNDCGLVNSFAGNGANGMTWAYNWDSHHNGLTAAVNYVPMLWGDVPDHTNRWHSNAEKMLSAGANHLLSFNECDNAGQANMSPGHAASAHVQYMNQYADRARIGSPAITNSNIPGESVDWLRGWVDACDGTGCKYDFCVAHWYASASTPSSEVRGYLDRVHEACRGKPVWLTEFAPSGSDEEVAAFLDENLRMFDELPYLERYSYFMMRVGSLLQAPNQPSRYGAKYFGFS